MGEKQRLLIDQKLEVQSQLEGLKANLAKVCHYAFVVDFFHEDLVDGKQGRVQWIF